MILAPMIMQVHAIAAIMIFFLPKLYSAANNMDPGPIPPELTVSLKLFSHIYCVESYYTLHGTHHCFIESQ